MASQFLYKNTVEAALQQKYIELLEKRVNQLETVVKESESKNGEGDKEGGDDDKEIDGADKGKDSKSTGRYVVALRVWDKSSASYRDKNVAEDVLKKAQHKDVAYIFRRVMYDTYAGEKRAYSEVEIEDPGLVQLLKSEIDNKYPGVNLDGHGIYMQAPFPAIIHNWEKLRKRAEQEPESQSCKDLAHLLGRIESAEELEDYFKTRVANAGANVTTFETLWTLFAPKTLLVAKPYMGVPQLLQVSSPPIPFSRVPIKDLQRLWMTAWCWDWNGKKMVKVHYALKFKRFRGTKQINELDFYPLAYHEGADELCDAIGKRSEAFLNATKFCEPGAGQTFKYEGMAFVARRKVVAGNKEEEADDDDADVNNEEDDASRNKVVPIKGEIICDSQAYLQYANANRSHALGDMEHEWIEEPTTEMEDAFTHLKKEDVAKRIREKSNDMLILPPRLLGYATREKLWGQFNIDSTKPPPGKQPNKFHKDLQLDKRYKDLIEALVTSHEERRVRQVKDVVSDKGKGLVLLLHGPPGVGKTLTAETIAEASGKPLFVVSVAEIGLDASRAEKNLEKLFNLATKWEAILLIDEADVFLETRGSTSDASRNALVSVLLRVLEYYKGVISEQKKIPGTLCLICVFMTTNRIKSIDVAVISRIHLAIRYDDLTAEQMKSIFKFFLDQLEPELIHDRDSIEEFIEQYGHHYGLNGRQIRNVVAAALASAQHGKGRGDGDGKLSAKHLSRVCEMTRNFQEQLKENSVLQRANNEALFRR